MTVQAKRDISRKLRILNHGRESGNIFKTCSYFGISREIFYQWKRTYEEVGEKGLINKKPCSENPKIRVPKHVEDKILYLRRTIILVLSVLVGIYNDTITSRFQKVEFQECCFGMA